MEWQFNSQIAAIFAGHARQHIPDYERVLDLTVDLCNQKLAKDSPILEIGCAVGETVTRLKNSGFTNIHAVDNSQSMLDRCPPGAATYYLSDDFPDTDLRFDAVICNWTMHFMSNKVEYLRKIANNMNPGGIFVLSDKTENSGLALEQYHLYKSRHGVSDQEIQEKAQSLVGVMHIDDIGTYFSLLKILRFREISIASANWCFTTFVAVK